MPTSMTKEETCIEIASNAEQTDVQYIVININDCLI